MRENCRLGCSSETLVLVRPNHPKSSGQISGEYIYIDLNGSKTNKKLCLRCFGNIHRMTFDTMTYPKHRHRVLNMFSRHIKTPLQSLS